MSAHGKVRRGRSAAFACLLLLALPTWAGPSPAQRVRQAVTRYMAESGVVGCSVAIADGGFIRFQGGFGFADLENRVKVIPATVFRLASVSKPITATAIMQLVGAKRVDLDADARTYVPEFPAKAFPFTVRQLLDHQSGIRHYKVGEGVNREPYSSVKQSLTRFENDPLLHKPGEQTSYSTYAYTLLARLVENVSAQTFPAYLRAHVFLKAQMAASGTEDLRAIVPNRARGYTRDKDGRIVNSPYADISYKWGGGGLVSTAPDLCHFAIALLDGRLMTPATLATMWTPQKLNNGTETVNALGWVVVKYRGRRMVNHVGGQEMVRTMLMIFPDQNAAIAVLTNFENHNVATLGKLIADAWFGDPLQTSK